MPRKKIERPAKGQQSMIDMKTGAPAGRTALPVLCERIRFFRERAGMEQKALAARIGITANAISNWETGRGRPDINLLPDICDALGVSLYDLYDLADPSGSYTAGEQLFLEQYRRLSPGHRAAVDQLTGTLLRVQETENLPALTRLTYFPKSLSAGFGDPTEFEGAGEPIWLYASPETERADCVFSVSGDSMEPEFHDGDKVLVARIPEASELLPGETGAFIVGNETYIKRYAKDGLESLNPKYETLHFADTEAVYLIGRVLGTLDPAQTASPEDVERWLAFRGAAAPGFSGKD